MVETAFLPANLRHFFTDSGSIAGDSVSPLWRGVSTKSSLAAWRSGDPSYPAPLHGVSRFPQSPRICLAYSKNCRFRETRELKAGHNCKTVSWPRSVGSDHAGSPDAASSITANRVSGSSFGSLAGALVWFPNRRCGVRTHPFGFYFLASSECRHFSPRHEIPAVSREVWRHAIWGKGR